MTITTLVLYGVLFFAQPAAPAHSLGPSDTFDTAHLTQDDVRQIIAAIEPSAYDTPDSWTAELRAKRVDLGNGAGLVLQGSTLLCGGTGNCQVFVLQRKKGHWVSLLGNAQAPLAEAFQFGPGISHGMKDFTVIANTSAGLDQRVTYQFDGRRYRPKQSQ